MELLGEVYAQVFYEYDASTRKKLKRNEIQLEQEEKKKSNEDVLDLKYP